MQSLEYYLTEASKAISENTYRYEISKSDLISILVSGSLFKDDKEAASLIENDIKTATKHFNINGFSIYYSHYSEYFVFERILSWNHIERIIEKKNANLELELQNRISHLSGTGFEFFCRELFNSMPDIKEISMTKKTRDGGIDFQGIINTGDEESTFFGQAKHWTSKFNSSEFRDFIGAMTLDSKKPCCLGFIVCTGGFTQPVIDKKDKSPFEIELIDMEGLIEKILMYNIGYDTNDYKMDVIIDKYWDEYAIFDD